MEEHPFSFHLPRASSSRLVHHPARPDVAQDVEAYLDQHGHLGDPVGPVVRVLLPPSPLLEPAAAAAAAAVGRAGSPGAAAAEHAAVAAVG